MTDEELQAFFTYHAPKPDQLPRYEQLRWYAKEFATAVVNLCPAGPDTTTAVRKIREAVMMANASIALES